MLGTEWILGLKFGIVAPPRIGPGTEAPPRPIEEPSSPPKIVFDADVPTLKSIRRYSERLVRGKTISPNASTMLDVRDIQGSIANGNYRRAGTGFHDLNFGMARDAQSRGFLQNLNIDKSMKTPNGYLPSRRPDYLFRWDRKSYDIKPFRSSPDGYDNTPQFQDIEGATGILPTPFYYRLW
jgi:hypothetical protein